MFNRYDGERNLVTVTLDNGYVSACKIGIVFNGEMPLVFAQSFKLLWCYLENVCHGGVFYLKINGLRYGVLSSTSGIIETYSTLLYSNGLTWFNICALISTDVYLISITVL